MIFLIDQWIILGNTDRKTGYGTCFGRYSYFHTLLFLWFHTNILFLGDLKKEKKWFRFRLLCMQCWLGVVCSKIVSRFLTRKHTHRGRSHSHHIFLLKKGTLLRKLLNCLLPFKVKVEQRWVKQCRFFVLQEGRKIPLGSE